MSRKQKVPTVEYADGVNLFTMHGMQHVVYVKSLKVLIYCNQLLFTAYCLVNAFGAIT